MKREPIVNKQVDRDIFKHTYNATRAINVGISTRGGIRL